MALDTQVLYLGRWTPREHFRTYVYSDKGQKLCESYDVYVSAIAGGEWYSQPDLVPYAGEKVVPIQQQSIKKSKKNHKGAS